MAFSITFFKIGATMRRPLVFGIAIFCGVGVDLLSKWLVFTLLKPGASHPLIPNVLHVTLAQNQGVAFSLFRDQKLFVLSVAIVAITVMVWLYLRNRRTAPALLLVSLGLLLTGAIGNLIDRAAFGYVRDFIDFVPRLPLIGHWAVFNFADICITVGVLMYLFSELFGKSRTADAKS